MVKTVAEHYSESEALFKKDVSRTELLRTDLREAENVIIRRLGYGKTCAEVGSRMKRSAKELEEALSILLQYDYGKFKPDALRTELHRAQNQLEDLSSSLRIRAAQMDGTSPAEDLIRAAADIIQTAARLLGKAKETDNNSLIRKGS